MIKKIILLLLLSRLTLAAAEEYQSNNDFLASQFANTVPEAGVLWLTPELKQQAETILQHKAAFLRVRYWRQEQKTVWILEEIGKTEPITIGVVVEQDKISLLKVLAFRESRGWEVKHEFFTDQFKQAGLTEDLSLTQAIDGISGATLSVRALTKVAQLALLFTKQIEHEKN